MSTPAKGARTATRRAANLGWAVTLSLLATGADAAPSARPGTVEHGEPWSDAFDAPAPASALSLTSPNLSDAELGTALSYWQGACGGPALGLPVMTVGGPGLPVEVRRHGDSWSPSRRCGMTSVRQRDGRVVGYVIDVFVQQPNGAPCFPLADEIAHELGHVLGLGDDPRRAAAGTIMGARVRGLRRSVDAATCGRVAFANRTRSAPEVAAQRSASPAADTPDAAAPEPARAGPAY